VWEILRNRGRTRAASERNGQDRPAHGAFSGKVDFRFSAENATTQRIQSACNRTFRLNVNRERSSVGHPALPVLDNMPQASIAPVTR
jgi:hypothetical protein